MYKKAILACMLGVFLLAGCGGGGQDGAQREITERPTGEIGDDSSIGGGDGERPGDRDINSIDEAIRRMQTAYFDFDKYSLRDDAKRALEGNATILKDNPGVNIMIQGHCDERGTNEYNLALGERRAKATRDYLVRLGVIEDRMMIRSYGEEQPADPRHTEDAWAMNRRAQFERQ